MGDLAQFAGNFSSRIQGEISIADAFEYIAFGSHGARSRIEQGSTKQMPFQPCKCKAARLQS